MKGVTLVATRRYCHRVIRSSIALALLLSLTACGPRTTSNAPPAASPPAGSASTTASPQASPTAQVPSVTCKTGIAVKALLLIGQKSAGSLLYEVSNPTQPKLVCRIGSTSAHIVGSDTVAYLRPVSSAKTEIVHRSLQTGVESVPAALPFVADAESWRPDGSLAAYTVQPAELNPGNSIQVWLYANHSAAQLTTYPLPLADCICRFGLPDAVAALSPDGQYLVSGWPVGKGAEPFVVSRVADRTRVQSFDLGVRLVLWDRSGHRLFLIGQDSVRSWTPEAGITDLAGTRQWSFMPSVSPDGGQVVYTAYIDNAQTQLRAFVYDLRSATTRQLRSRPGSQVLFAKSGWVWYLEEASCDPNQCGPWGSGPNGKVFAQDLATGRETEVAFASNEAPLTLPNSGIFQARDVWPAE